MKENLKCSQYNYGPVNLCVIMSLRRRLRCPGYNLGSLEVISVSAHVSIEVPRLREPRIADLTLVGLFTCVGPVVFS